MFYRSSGLVTIAALLFTLIINSQPSAFNLSTESFRLHNGMTVILKESHGSPMVASVIFVRSGSKYETEYENGITHFLEHLLFDGTTSLTREELDGSIRSLGGYNNAFTRKELTGFMVLLPNQYIEYGLTLQADMLFHSIFPEEEMEKERKVVIEEINRSDDSPGAAAETFFVSKAYNKTPYDRPVLGYKPFIENIPREAIIDYWKEYYRPSNMTVLVIGDFETDAMKKVVTRIFEREENIAWLAEKIAGRSGAVEVDSLNLSSIDETEPLQRDSLIDLAQQPNMSGQTVFDTVANVQSTYINFSFDAPHFSSEQYPAMDLLSSYLGMDDISPLMIALKGGVDPPATEVSVSLVTYAEFSRLEISIIAEDTSNVDRIMTIITDHISSAANLSADPDALEGIKVSRKCEEIYYTEKLHYLGFYIAPMMMTAGWDFIQSYGAKFDSVSWPDCQTAAADWLNNPRYVATIVRPIGDNQSPYVSSGMTAEDVIAHFESTEVESFSFDSTAKVNYPATDSVSFEMVDQAHYHREDLASGMTVIIKSRPGSAVFAVNVLGKNRSASEGDSIAGITDFVNRCIEKGTRTRSGAELSRDLARIGANVTLYDNPWIPYDDRYTTHQYSFMKFETVDEFAEKGFYLFAEMILDPAFGAVEVENVRQSMLGILKRNSASPGKIARHLFYQTLFDGKAYSRPIMGTVESVEAISRQQLRDHHSRIYAPENMIISIMTGRSIPEVMSWVEGSFGRLASYGSKVPYGEPPVSVTEIADAHYEIDKEQISIYLGSALPGADSDETAAIAVAVSILSDRLYLNLREKQGLAYSVGASYKVDREFGWYYCSIGTGSENYRKALDGIILQIEKLKFDGPRQQEIDKARNQLWGRLMSAKLSSINQAYYLGLNEYLGRGQDWDNLWSRQLSQITIDSIRRVFARYFSSDRYVLATAGRRPEK